MPIPTRVELHKKSRTLELSFKEASYVLSAEYLRVFSPSAEVKGHGPGQEVLQLNKQDVGITQIEAQGKYAIKITFSDGHNTGLYSWNYLYELGKNYDKNWASYLARVKAHNEQHGAAPVRWITPQ